MFGQVLRTSLFVVSLCFTSTVYSFEDFSVTIRKDRNDYYKMTVISDKNRETQTVLRISEDNASWDRTQDGVYAIQETPGIWNFFLADIDTEVCFLSVNLWNGDVDFPPKSKNIPLIFKLLENKKVSIVPPPSTEKKHRREKEGGRKVVDSSADLTGGVRSRTAAEPAPLAKKSGSKDTAKSTSKDVTVGTRSRRSKSVLPTSSDRVLQTPRKGIAVHAGKKAGFSNASNISSGLSSEGNTSGSALTKSQLRNAQERSQQSGVETITVEQDVIQLPRKTKPVLRRRNGMTASEAHKRREVHKMIPVSECEKLQFGNKQKNKKQTVNSPKTKSVAISRVNYQKPSEQLRIKESSVLSHSKYKTYFRKHGGVGILGFSEDPAVQYTPINKADYMKIVKTPLPVRFCNNIKETAFEITNNGGGKNSCAFMAAVPWRRLAHAYDDPSAAVAEFGLTDPARSFIVRSIYDALSTVNHDDPLANEVKSWIYYPSLLKTNKGEKDSVKDERKKLEDGLIVSICTLYSELVESYIDELIQTKTVEDEVIALYIKNIFNVVVSRGILAANRSLDSIVEVLPTLAYVQRKQTLSKKRIKKIFVTHFFECVMNSYLDLQNFCNKYPKLWQVPQIRSCWRELHKYNAMVVDRYYKDTAMALLGDWGASGEQLGMDTISNTSGWVSIVGTMFNVNVFLVSGADFAENGRKYNRGSVICSYRTPDATTTILIGYRPGHYFKLVTVPQIYNFLNELANGAMPSFDAFMHYLDNGGKLPDVSTMQRLNSWLDNFYE